MSATVTVSPEMVANLRAWAAVLRSGTYSQAKSTLRNDDGYCCLGVMCELAVKDGLVDGFWSDDEASFAKSFFLRRDSGPFWTEAYDEGWPPVEVAERYGLRGRPPGGLGAVSDGRRLDGRLWRIGGQTYEALSAANDDGRTFAEIADGIDAYARDLELLLGSKGEQR